MAGAAKSTLVAHRTIPGGIGEMKMTRDRMERKISSLIHFGKPRFGMDQIAKDRTNVLSSFNGGCSRVRMGNKTVDRLQGLEDI